MMSIDPSVALRARGATLDFDHHPLLAIWEVTQACDLACEHCRACATPARDRGELSTEEGARVLDAIADMGTPVVVPTGRAGASLLLTASRIEALLEELHDISVTAPFDVKTTAAPHYRRISMQRRDPGGAKGLLRDIGADGVIHGMRGITDGVGFLFVSHTGEIYPSGFLPLSAGNVRRDDLAEVYRAHPLFTQLRDADALGGKCGQCPFRRVCGGSRARAWAMLGDVMAEDPLCAYVPRGASA